MFVLSAKINVFTECKCKVRTALKWGYFYNPSCFHKKAFFLQVLLTDAVVFRVLLLLIKGLMGTRLCHRRVTDRLGGRAESCGSPRGVWGRLGPRGWARGAV